MPLTEPIYGWPIADGPDPAKQYPSAVDQPFKQMLAAQLSALGGWAAWSPTITGALTVGNGTVTARWAKTGKTVAVALHIVLGSSSAMGSGQISVSLPAPARSPNTYLLGSGFSSAGVNAFNGMGRASGSTLTIYALASGGHGGASLSATVPFTWKATDSVQASGIYETT